MVARLPAWVPGQSEWHCQPLTPLPLWWAACSPRQVTVFAKKGGKGGAAADVEDKKGGKGGKGDAKGGKGGDVDLAKIEKEAKADAVRCAASEPLSSFFCMLLCRSQVSWDGGNVPDACCLAEVLHLHS